MVQETQQYREMILLELPNRLLDQKLIDFHEEKQNFYEKYDVIIMTEPKESDRPGVAQIKDIRSRAISSRVSCATRSHSRCCSFKT